MEKDWPKRPSDHHLQEAQKDSDRVITSVAEAVCVPAHLVPPGYPQAKQLGHLHALNSHWGRAATGKKKSCTCAYRVTSGVSDFCYSVDSGLPGFSVREGGSPGYTRAYWPILVAIPF